MTIINYIISWSLSTSGTGTDNPVNNSTLSYEVASSIHQQSTFEFAKEAANGDFKSTFTKLGLIDPTDDDLSSPIALIKTMVKKQSGKV